MQFTFSIDEDISPQFLQELKALKARYSVQLPNLSALPDLLYILPPSSSGEPQPASYFLHFSSGDSSNIPQEPLQPGEEEEPEDEEQQAEPGAAPLTGSAYQGESLKLCLIMISFPSIFLGGIITNIP